MDFRNDYSIYYLNLERVLVAVVLTIGVGEKIVGEHHGDHAAKPATEEAALHKKNNRGEYVILILNSPQPLHPALALSLSRMAINIPPLSSMYPVRKIVKTSRLDLVADAT